MPDGAWIKVTFRFKGRTRRAPLIRILTAEAAGYYLGGTPERPDPVHERYPGNQIWIYDGREDWGERGLGPMRDWLVECADIASITGEPYTDHRRPADL
jgi:hypothetical protein